MIQTWIHRIRPGKEERLREWFIELASRQEELQESFEAGGVRAEQAFLIATADGSLLVYVAEASDTAAANDAFGKSPLAIDREHRQIMDECVEDTIDAPPLHEFSI